MEVGSAKARKMASAKAQKEMSQFFIGTSGWSYEHWRGIFYPEDLKKTDWLAFYASHFRTVEINASFYHLPKKKTFENWRKTVGRDFIFSVKGSRYITHIKKLKDCREPVKKFFERVEGIEGKEGREGETAILWQLPPRMKKNVVGLKGFLAILPKNYRYAFEFRDESWLDREVLGCLGRSGAAVVFQDFDYWPMTEEITTDFVYIRLHGKQELYASCYTKKELEGWAKKIKGWLKKGLDVYVYFNNDMNGYAVKNAKELIKLCNYNITKKF